MLAILQVQLSFAFGIDKVFNFGKVKKTAGIVSYRGHVSTNLKVTCFAFCEMDSSVVSHGQTPLNSYRNSSISSHHN